MHVLFDPLMLTRESFGEGEDWEWLESQVDQGHALLYQAGGDGDFQARLVVQKKAAPTDEGHIHRVVDKALLRVCSGTLWLSGAEYLPAPSSQPGEDMTVDIPDHMGTRVELPAGDYRVDVDVAAFGEKQMAAHEAALAERTTSFDRRFERLAGPLAGGGLFGTLIAALIAGIAICAGEWQIGLILIGVGFLCGLAALALGRASPMKRMHEARQTVERDFPSCWIRLTPLDDVDSRPMRGAMWHIDDELQLAEG